MTDVIDAPSPNHAARHSEVSMLVLHYTGMASGAEALERLRDPEAGVSAHYVLEENGDLYRLVAEDRTAWHAGLGGWRDVDNVNDASIGIEIVNPGHYFGYRPFPQAQIVRLLPLVEAIIARYAIKPVNVVAHSDIAPGRKDDPGELFPWELLAEKGLAIPQYSGQPTSEMPDFDQAFAALSHIGYHFDPKFPVSAVLAFQRRFCPQDLGQGLSPLTRSAIAWVAAQV